ncbi:hypothetical protein MNBD_GAMMA26-1086 [hydrothermal vent metagenome]|uniref:CopG family transcriptional regulator n=1 Tax=hydrothermal vent metagenome TaxID=652676 RepID=A0A3B1B758_9ZZZZ
MGQVTIYLEDAVEHKMVAAAKSAHLSKSKWIASLIQDKVTNEWPRSIVDLAGTWEDFPLVDDMRLNIGKDASREEI